MPEMDDTGRDTLSPVQRTFIGCISEMHEQLSPNRGTVLSPHEVRQSALLVIMSVSVSASHLQQHASLGTGPNGGNPD